MKNLNLTDLQKLMPEDLIHLILKQNEVIRGLEERIKQLEEQVAKNSRNSGKPPSSDGLQKPKSLRAKGQRPSGGQKGHVGHRLEPVAAPDEIVHYELVSCPKCQGDLQGVEVETTVKRQVFDLPPVRLQVTEHQAEVKYCAACRTHVMATLPEKVSAATQYGTRFKAQLAYLNGYQFIPTARLAELCADFYGQPISEGLVTTLLAELSAAVEPSLAVVRDQVVQAAVAHSDETGVRVAGTTQWWHVFATPYLTYYCVHAKRGQVALHAGGLLDQFQGCLVHDAFVSYFVFDQCQHALCNAHLLRELTFVFEELQQDWAGTLKNLLLEIKATVSHAQSWGHAHLTALQMAQFTQAYTDLIYNGWQVNPLPDPPAAKKRGRIKHSTPQNLLRRLEKYPDLILAFMHDFRVPFDNNLAERDLRMVKVKQKISGCFRTQAGAEMFARIRSYISTARKQGINVLLAITDALTGQPFIPTSPPV